MELTHSLITDFTEDNNHNVNVLLKWWSLKTHQHENLLCRTPAFLRNNLICAVAAYMHNRPIGAAGIIPLFDKDMTKIYHTDGKLVGEFCANYVSPLYGSKGIATDFIQRRTEYAFENNILPISVTRQHKIVDIFTRLGWEQMDKLPEYNLILGKVRNCDCHSDLSGPFVGERCAICPLLERIIWVKRP